MLKLLGAVGLVGEFALHLGDLVLGRRRTRERAPTNDVAQQPQNEGEDADGDTPGNPRTQRFDRGEILGDHFAHVAREVGVHGDEIAPDLAKPNVQTVRECPFHFQRFRQILGRRLAFLLQAATDFFKVEDHPLLTLVLGRQPHPGPTVWIGITVSMTVQRFFSQLAL